MEFRKRIHPHYYHQGILVSAKDKDKLNLLIIQKLQSLLNEIREKKPYVELYWYTCYLQTFLQDFKNLWQCWNGIEMCISQSYLWTKMN